MIILPRAQMLSPVSQKDSPLFISDLSISVCGRPPRTGGKAARSTAQHQDSRYLVASVGLSQSGHHKHGCTTNSQVSDQDKHEEVTRVSFANHIEHHQSFVLASGQDLEMSQ